MTTTAVIVGAGIGGLATAVGLRRAGWEVTVLERWAEVVNLGTGLGIWPQAQQALDRLGVGARVTELAVPHRSATVRRPDGRPLAELSLARLERRSGRPLLLVSRTALIGVLLDALAGTPIRTGVQITDPDQLRAGYDLVVGADGLRSAVRAAYFDAASRPRDAQCVAWRGTVPYEVDGYGETWGRGLMFGITPVEHGRTNWYTSVTAGPDAPTDLAGLRAAYARWHHPIPALLADAAEADVLRHELYDLAPGLRSFVHGNVALVGDAAHAMTPFLGQGACQALLDAATPAGCLVGCPAGTVDLASGLHDYDARRRRPTQRLVRTAWRMGKVVQARRFTRLRTAALRAGSLLVR